MQLSLINHKDLDEHCSLLLSVGRAELGGRGRPEGRPHGEPPGRQRQPPGADVRRRYARAEVQERRPLRQGHGRPLGRAHHRQGTVRVVQRAPRPRRRGGGGGVQGGHGLPAVAAAAVLGIGGVGAGAPGPRHAGYLRQPVLHQPPLRRRPSAVRPGASDAVRRIRPRDRGRRGRRPCGRLRVRRLRLLPGLCGVHAAYGEARVRRRRRGPHQLQGGEQPELGSDQSPYVV